jgi:arginase family enzyme
VFTIPANIEKTFEQISKAVGHVYSSGAFPVVLGGDHSIGYPTTRAAAEHLGGGKLGIIHFDRHVNTQETDLDERMHTTPWFHATDIPNVPPQNPGADRHWRLAGASARGAGRPGARHDDHDRHRLRGDVHQGRRAARPGRRLGRYRRRLAVL